MKGKFITIEGIDGTGKSTLTANLAQFLLREGYDVVVTTEPTDTWLGKNVKRGFNEPISPFTECFLFSADRCEHTKWINEELEKGKIVLCDRYADSTYAYQGAALASHIPDAVNWLIEISKYIVREPDVTILLVARAEVVLGRIESRATLTKFEKCAYLKKVEEIYLQLAKRYERIKVIDAEQSAEQVFEQSKQIVLSCIESRNRMG
jgi:dTMP kinase